MNVVYLCQDCNFLSLNRLHKDQHENESGHNVKMFQKGVEENREALRTCIDCGLRAYTLEDLKEFGKAHKAKYMRSNICRRCRNVRTRARLNRLESLYITSGVDY